MHDNTELTDHELRVLRRATRIIEKLQRQSLDDDTRWHYYQDVGKQIDRIIIQHTIRHGRVEP